MPKGVKTPMTIYEIGGIKGKFNLVLPEKTEIHLMAFPHPVHITFTILEGKHACEEVHSAMITKLNKQVAEVIADRNCRELTNLKISVFDEHEHEICDDVYAKVIENMSESPPQFRIHFTSVPPNAQIFFEQILSRDDHVS